jgi:hypothetical protein
MADQWRCQGASKVLRVSALGQPSNPQRFATLIYSAIGQCSEQVMKQQLERRKAFILLTDAVAFRDQTSIGTAIEFAQRADTILYSIVFLIRSGPTGPFELRFNRQ